MSKFIPVGSVEDIPHTLGLSINLMRDIAWDTAQKSGFGTQHVPTALALVHSEVSEALEADRRPLKYRNEYIEEQGLVPLLKGDNIVVYGKLKHGRFIASGIEQVSCDTVDAAGKARQRAHFSEELADIVIRVATLAGSLDIDLEKAISDKLETNKTREFKHGDKAY